MLLSQIAALNLPPVPGVSQGLLGVRGKRAVRVQRVGLNKHSLELDGLQQLAQSLNLTTGIAGVSRLGNRHAQRLGIEAHLSNETLCTGVVLSDGALQRSLDPRA